MMITLFMLILMLIGLIQTDEPSYQQILFRHENLSYYQLMISKMFMMISPFFVVLFVMDHDQQHLRPLVSYFGRLKIIGGKIIFYILVLTWLYLMFLMLYETIPFFLTDYFVFDRDAIHLFLSFYLDGLLIMNLILFFIKDRHKALSVLFAVFYLVLSLFSEDHSSLILFVVFPIHSSLFFSLNLAYPYKLCYIGLGFILIFIKMLNEAI